MNIVLLQDIIKADEIKLDWLFKASMINDIVNVSNNNLLFQINDFIPYTSAPKCKT